MPNRRRPELVLEDAMREHLQALTVSYTAPLAHVERAKILLGYASAYFARC